MRQCGGAVAADDREVALLLEVEPQAAGDGVFVLDDEDPFAGVHQRRTSAGARGGDGAVSAAGVRARRPGCLLQTCSRACRRGGP